MIRAREFIDAARREGFDFYTGVPCSYLTPLINGVISSNGLRYVGAASEGEAVGIAAGAWLAGCTPVVMCQNSGLGNAINPLTSLNAPFRIPCLLIVTWRGQPGHPDEPQHELMGRITGDLLTLVSVPHERFPDSAELLAGTIGRVRQQISARSLPYALVLEDGSVADEHLLAGAPRSFAEGIVEDLRTGGDLPARASYLEVFLAHSGNERAVIATTGKTGRELFMLADRPQHLYLVGSMGCAPGVALGVACNTKRQVVVLDGDGAALMKLGTLATIGAYAPENLVHVLLDNGVHDSTGGQPTVSSGISFPGIAQACGYRFVASCDTLAAFKELFLKACARKGPSFVHVRVKPGSLPKLVRPDVAPADVARRFQAFLASP